MSRSDRHLRKGSNPPAPWNVEPPLEALEPRIALTTSWQTPDLLPEQLATNDDAATLAVTPPAPPPADDVIQTIDGGSVYLSADEQDATTESAVDDVLSAADLASADPSAPVAVIQDGQGALVAAFNRSGTLASFDIEGEEFAWDVDDEFVGRLDGDNSFAGYRDPSTGEARLVVAGRDGLRILMRDKAGGLVDVPSASPVITRGVTAFVSTDGRAHVAGLSDDGALLLSYERMVPGRDGPERQWTTADLSTDHLGVRGLETPRFAGALHSFTTPWGGMNIVGVDVDGQVWSVWWAPGMRLWTATNLTAAAGHAQPMVGNLVGMSTPWGSLHVFGTDAQGHLHALNWSASNGAGGWTSEDLTRTTGAPTLRAGTLAGFRSSWNTLSVFGVDRTGDVRATWWTPRVGRWISESVSAELRADAPRIAGPLSGYVARDGTQNLVGATDSGRIVRLSWSLDGSDAWNADDLSEKALGR